MAGKLNWESASRADRVARQGYEPVYRGLSTGGWTRGSELALDAYEQVAKRAGAKAQKRDRNLAARAQAAARAKLRRDEARKQKKARARVEAQRTRSFILEQLVAQVTSGNGAANDDVECERIIVEIDALLNKPELAGNGNPATTAARAAVVGYLDELRKRASPIPDYRNSDLFVTTHQDMSCEVVVSHLSRKLRACNARDGAQLYSQMQASLAKIGTLSKRGKRLLTLELVAARIVAVTPAGRILYFRKYEADTSN